MHLTLLSCVQHVLYISNCLTEHLWIAVNDILCTPSAIHVCYWRVIALRVSFCACARYLLKELHLDKHTLYSDFIFLSSPLFCCLFCVVWQVVPNATKSVGRCGWSEEGCKLNYLTKSSFLRPPSSLCGRVGKHTVEFTWPARSCCVTNELVLKKVYGLAQRMRAVWEVTREYGGVLSSVVIVVVVVVVVVVVIAADAGCGGGDDDDDDDALLAVRRVESQSWQVTF
jgi:hypothetical protein